MNAAMIQRVALGFGAVYLLVGILGFVPVVTQPTATPGQGLLLGIFAVNALHNVTHLVLGATLVYAGMAAEPIASKVLWGLTSRFSCRLVSSRQSWKRRRSTCRTGCCTR